MRVEIISWNSREERKEMLEEPITITFFQSVTVNGLVVVVISRKHILPCACVCPYNDV